MHMEFLLCVCLESRKLSKFGEIESFCSDIECFMFEFD